jgi:hypothetical protein
MAAKLQIIALAIFSYSVMLRTFTVQPEAKAEHGNAGRVQPCVEVSAGDS